MAHQQPQDLHGVYGGGESQRGMAPPMGVTAEGPQSSHQAFTAKPVQDEVRTELESGHGCDQQDVGGGTCYEGCRG